MKPSWQVKNNHCCRILARLVGQSNPKMSGWKCQAAKVQTFNPLTNEKHLYLVMPWCQLLGHFWLFFGIQTKIRPHFSEFGHLRVWPENSYLATMQLVYATVRQLNNWISSCLITTVVITAVPITNRALLDGMQFRNITTPLLQIRGWILLP